MTYFLLCSFDDWHQGVRVESFDSLDQAERALPDILSKGYSVRVIEGRELQVTPVEVVKKVRIEEPHEGDY